MKMQLSAIIVSYNVKYYLAQCILSLLKSGTALDFEIIVVDNASSDGTEDLLHQLFPAEWGSKLKFIENKHNAGFGKANNQALKIAQGQFILYINPDTLVGEDTLLNCLAFYEKHPAAGALGVRMLQANGAFAPESRRGNPNPFTSLCKILGLTKLFPHSKTFGKYYLQYLDEKQICPIDIVSGAFMMLPRPLLDLNGAFDEDFFMYGEDIDLSYRIQKSGHQNFYLPTPILHYKGESTNKASRRYVNSFYKAMAIFFRKHYKNTLLFCIPLYIAIYALAVTALAKQQILRLKQFLAKQDSSSEIYHFIVSPANENIARRLSDKFQLNSEFSITEDFETGIPLKSIAKDSKKNYFVIYDMEKSTISKILATFDAENQKNCLIGAFYPSQSTVITNQKVYQL